MVAVRIRRQARRRPAGPDEPAVEAVVPADAAALLRDAEDVLAAIDAALE
jgi:hypothetical protein